MAEEIALTTIEGIEIATVGEEWRAATGPFTLTHEHIVSVIASQADPTIKSPRVKLGHFDDRFTPNMGLWDGQPVFGKFTNLRTSADGKTLIGDIVGCPQWFAQVAPFAWPSRSGEWVLDYTSDAGKEYPCVLPAVACLSVTLPAISKIEDLPLLFTASIPRGLRVDGEVFTNRKTEDMPTARVIPTAVTAPDVTNSFLKDFAQGDYYYFWPTRVYINPSAVIATDDENGDEFFIPYTAGRDGITWGEPVPAKHQYVGEDGAVLAGRTPAAVFTSRADLVPVPTSSKEPTGMPDRQIEDRSTNAPENTPSAGIDGAALRSLLRLPEDADDAAVNDAILEAATTPSRDEETPQIDAEQEAVLTAMRDGKVTVVSTDAHERDQKRLEELENFVKTSRAEMAKERQASKVEKLLTGGWITPAEKEYYTELAETNEEGFDRLAERLTSGKPRVPLHERGVNPEPETLNTSEGTGLFPELDTRKDS